MRFYLKLLLPVPLLISLITLLGGCGCGFDCSDDDNNNRDPARLYLGFSDSLPEDLKQVFIEVDTITFKRSGAADVVVDTFTIEQQGLVDAPTFKVDLLKYPGISQLLVIENREFTPATYSEVVIAILDTDINNSYVKTEEDTLRRLAVTGGSLTLNNLKLSSGTQRYTIEFGLAQSLQYDVSSDTYLLTPNGVRIENNLTDARLSGQVDSALFNSVSPCTEKGDPLQGNRVYLYQESSLAAEILADVFTDASSETAPADAIAPFAVASVMLNGVTGNWEYAFGYLPPGEYTMAFSCDTQTDDSVEYNDLPIPLPQDQIYNISLAEKENAQCNLSENASC